mmetsp:Transcript_120927/g.342033  ORF Transcript_120927/g.342033 Transcript_120927/m.342033 type:complete len:228 (+) Transcript_120927:354-1037(+)
MHAGKVEHLREKITDAHLPERKTRRTRCCDNVGDAVHEALLVDDAAPLSWRALDHHACRFPPSVHHHSVEEVYEIPLVDRRHLHDKARVQDHELGLVAPGHPQQHVPRVQIPMYKVIRETHLHEGVEAKAPDITAEHVMRESPLQLGSAGVHTSPYVPGGHAPRQRPPEPYVSVAVKAIAEERCHGDAMFEGLHKHVFGDVRLYHRREAHAQAIARRCVIECVLEVL